MDKILTFARPKPAALGHYRHIATLHDHGFLCLILARVEDVNPPMLHLLLDGLSGEPEPVALTGLSEDREGARDALEIAALLATTEWNDPMDQASRII